MHGIANVTMNTGHLRLGRTGSVVAVICANPKPNVMWIQEKEGTAVRAGQTIGRFVAFPLESVASRQSKNGKNSRQATECAKQ